MNAADLEALLIEGLYAHRDEESRARAEAKGTDQRTNPFITELGKPCDRAVWRNLHDYDGEDFDAAALLQFAGGHAFEELLAGIFKGQKIEVLREIRVELPADGTVITGRVDFLLMAGGHIVELKTIGASALEMMIRKKEPGKKDHASQLNAYLHATQLGALKYRDPELNVCACGHRKADHIYHAGACRPGYECPCAGFDSMVALFPQHKGFLVYGNIKPDWKAPLSYEKPIHVIEVSYDMLRARREIDHVAALWRREDEPPLPQGYSAERFPCGSRRKDGTIKTWCAHHAYCWGE